MEERPRHLVGVSKVLVGLVTQGESTTDKGKTAESDIYIYINNIYIDIYIYLCIYISKMDFLYIYIYTKRFTYIYIRPPILGSFRPRAGQSP